MLVTTGKTRVENLISGKTTSSIYTLRLGTDNTAADVAQTALIAPVLSQPCLAVVSGSVLTLTAIFQSDGATYKEVGVFAADAVMLYRKVVTNTVYTSGSLFIVQVTITIS